MIDLFISEACPYCQKVMKYFEENNIEYNKIDTADEDNVLRLMTLGGKDQVPFLVDGDVKMYESSDIIEYLKTKIV
jgi:glutaredoxin